MRKEYVEPNQFYGMSRHFVWMIPLADLLLFTLVGLALAIVVRWGTWGRMIALRTLGTLALLPLVWSAFPRIYGAAGLLLASGVMARLVPALHRRAGGFARIVRLSFPAAIGLVVILGAWCWAD